MLICITQGFLTVFAGEPGTGKTSICDKIAQLLGASRKNGSDENRYLSISVERGWTSKSDLIGYINSLNNDEVVDTTGLHEALKKVTDESEEETPDPYLVLLDEANLSQMEYYWSSFIKLADDDARRKTPLHFGKDDFIVPDWFKFLATINNDQTTESLSPRLLDRAWVITLPTLDELNADNQQDDDYDRISWDNLQKMFEGISETDQLFKYAEVQLEEIYEEYRNGENPVSPRSKKAIKAYLKSALSCFEGNDEQKIDNAIDFILLQRLLPMLNGYIPNKLKDDLKNILSQTTEENELKYPLSAKKFESMCKQEDFSSSSFVNFFM